MSLAAASGPGRVLVTGASGFLGRAVVARLVAEGWEVDAVRSRRDLSGTRPTDWQEEVTWHQADLLDRRSVEDLLGRSRADHLVHLAWAPNRGVFRSPDNFGWVTASADLVSGFFDGGGRRVVAAGSGAEYDWRLGVCHEQTTRLGGGAVYGACKRAFGELFSGLCQHHGSRSPGARTGAWARIFFLFGPYEPEERLVAAVTRALLAGERVSCSDGRQIRDYLFVEDAADALVRLLESDLSGPVNIASGQGIRVRDLVRRLADRTGGGDRVEWGEPDEFPFVVADTGRLRGELGWQPRIGLERGLDRTVEWWRSRLQRPAASA